MLIVSAREINERPARNWVVPHSKFTMMESLNGFGLYELRKSRDRIVKRLKMNQKTKRKKMTQKIPLKISGKNSSALKKTISATKKCPQFVQ